MSKNYKIVEREGKKIAYPENMDNKVIKILEEARVNRNFLNLIFGNKITGKAWDETFDTKGIIGLSKGSEYYFPILVSFSEDYDFLNEIPSKNNTDFYVLRLQFAKEVAEWWNVTYYVGYANTFDNNITKSITGGFKTNFAYGIGVQITDPQITSELLYENIAGYPYLSVGVNVNLGNLLKKKTSKVYH